MNNYYYDINNDIEKYSNAWAFIIIGGRNTGKTYSTLKDCLINNRKFVFIKRTIDDVNLLCAGSGRVGNKLNEYGIDLSPFKSINRDMGTNIKAYSIKQGLGGFWSCDSDDNPEGAPIGYILALSAVQKFKGFDLSDCDWLIFDEFIPQPWERVNKKEGEQLLDLYKTISRDREHRQKAALKLICLANATNISNPVMNIFELTDIVANMQLNHKSIYYDEREILLHLINDNLDFMETEKSTQIYKAMHDTSWGHMAFNNEFAYNDLSNIGKIKMKNYKPVVSIRYKTNQYYIYMKDGHYYMCTSKNNNSRVYDLNLENDQKAFYIDYVIDFRNSCINNMFLFESYTMYDLIINYKKFFNV